MAFLESSGAAEGGWGRWRGDPHLSSLLGMLTFQPRSQDRSLLQEQHLPAHRLFRHFTDEEPEACRGQGSQRAQPGRWSQRDPDLLTGWRLTVRGGRWEPGRIYWGTDTRPRSCACRKVRAGPGRWAGMTAGAADAS